MKRGRGLSSARPAYGVSSMSFDADVSCSPVSDSRPADVAAQDTTTAMDTREDAAEDASVDVSLSFRTGSSLCVTSTGTISSMVEGGDVGHSRGMVVDNLVSARSYDGLGTVAPGSDDDDDDAASLGREPSIMSDTSSIASALDDLGGVDVALELGFLGSMDLDAVKTYEVLAAPEVEEMHVDGLGIGVKYDDVKGSICVEQMEVQVREAMTVGLRSVFLKDCVPLWGCISICGRRPEMEDAVVAVPHFFNIPLKMLIGDCAVDGLNPCKFNAPSHFFGVYDGHGGAQVANYCQERMHLALIDKLRILKEGLEGIISIDCQKHWERAFSECFLKVDDEVGGKVSRGDHGSTSEAISVESRLGCSANLDPVAPETVGSTAVVSIICSSHIIVANCGDSRAVLCRGKQAMPLSVDHKPNREDEYARIEAAGGKVIQWNGYRVFGVLAMSRSIGDRYLKPWIIPEPEVRIISRIKEDECLILASDGLWDVMSNEEVCDAARRRLLLWHKKNSSVASDPAQRGLGADAASQAAAEYLSKLALQRGSKDNITVIVIDLKTQRKFKTKT